MVQHVAQSRLNRGPAVSPELAAALNREGLEDCYTPDGNGGAVIDMGTARMCVVSGPVDELAALFPDMPPTHTDRGHGAVLLDMMDSELYWPISVPDGDNERHIHPHVSAQLSPSVWAVAGGALKHIIPADAVVGTIYAEVGNRRLTPAVREFQATVHDALLDALPDARTAALTRVETDRRARENARLPEHILADRRAERERAEVERDRAARHSDAAPNLTPDGRALLTGEVSILDVIRGGVKRERPSVYPVAGGRHLFYAGKTHTVFGPGGTGKSTLAQAACMAVLNSDPAAHVLYIDYEDTAGGVGIRLAAMGMTETEADRFHYLPAPSRSVVAGLQTGEFALVIVDGVEGALSAHGAGMNDYKGWHDSVVLPIATETGAAVVLLDHPGHNGERPIGSVFKVNALTGAAYRLDAKGRLYLAGTDGKAKDRPRGLDDLTGPGDLLARVALTETGDDMTVTVTMYPDMPDDDRDRAEGAPGGLLDTWMTETGAELSRGEVVAVVIALEGGRVTAGKVPGLVRKYAPTAYRGARKGAWETEAVNAAAGAGFIVHPSTRATKSWVIGTLSEGAAAAVSTLSESTEE
jgi:hypothetical protein